MKMLLSVLAIVTSFPAFSDYKQGTELKSCSTWLAKENIRACIELLPATPQCANIQSGDLWVDEFGVEALDELFTKNKDYCYSAVDIVPYGGKNHDETVTYCCGG